MKREVKIGIFGVTMIIAAWAGIRFLKGFDIFSRNSVYYAAYDQINVLCAAGEDLDAAVSADEEAADEDDDAADEDEDAGDDDIASEPFYEVACPACGETVYVSEDDLDAGEANCAHCGVTFEVALEGDEDEAKDAPVQYEVTCPACGKTAVFEEDELLDGAPKCPNCGEPLDFEVTEE